MNVEEFIAHHGVKGMKWGVRKSGSGRRPSGDYKRTAELRKRKPHELTNKQMKDVIARRKIEGEYAGVNPKALTRGKMKVAALLATAGIAVTAYNTINSPAGKAAQEAGKKAIAKMSAEAAKRSTRKVLYKQLSFPGM